MFEPPSAEAILAARKALVAADPALAAVEAVTPAFAWRVGLGGFPGLLKMIVQQQVSLASAAAIWARVEAGLPEMTPAIVAAHDETYLRTLGLSQPKARYARAIAEAHLSGACDFDALRALPDEEAVAALTAIKGVGRWTAEVFLMFTQGRMDLFPGGDVALQEAMRWVDGAQARPTEKQAYARAELWRPYRGVAAHMLWACYGAVKRREIAPF
ncbi:DNA-3-methyladenine glycosylase 2 family protein [Caulobacter vibrioides]|uniref:DNA-3-methyladenine glycosylase II n=1 Tax=Caulobacter vibrioides TaxID=155892 RepID=A0A290MRF9_CAUVI|nr:DNA-3-methyladenine glycosylase [Caulobacter vibrioides]ATC32421.1 DNA-3-methyladenine glycosylase 2 family protein [Caulobacter vibrioides]